MKTLPRLLGLALLASCSSKSNDGFVAISINTGDLALPTDSGRVGLYITQLDENGRSSSLVAAEEPVRLVDGVPSVRFPSLLVVVSNGENARIRARLVAYAKETRDVLTMRESRTKVPTDGSSLLRMNLFFTNQGNVQDATPGVAVPTTTSGAALGADSTLQIRQAAAGDADPYARFHSVCDGALAADDMTAGDDGHCVPLDAKEPELAAYDAEVGAPFSHEGDDCYDVLQTFDPRSDGAVPQLATQDLPTTGDCRVELPRAFDPASLNVAVAGIGGFPGTSQYPAGLRPLAVNLAFRQDGTSIVLPERVCALARTGTLVFSQRTKGWGGVDPVCSPFAFAKAERGYEGPAPSGDRDAGPDAAAPSAASYDVTGASLHVSSIAARQGDLVLLTTSDDLTFQVARYPAISFALGGPQSVPFHEFFASSGASARAVSLGVGGVPEFYLDRPEEGLAFVDAEYKLPPVQGPGGRRAAIAQLAGQGQVAWTETDADAGSLLKVAALSTTDPIVVGAGFTVNTPLSTDVDLLPEIGALGTDRIILPASRFDNSYYDCQLGGACERKTIARISQTVTRGTATRIDTRLVGFYFDGGLGTVMVDFTDPVPSEDAVTQTLDNPIQAVPVGDRVCGLYENSATSEHQVRCHGYAEIRAGERGTTVLRGVDSAAIDADEQYLYIAYDCAQTPGTVHVSRVPHAALAEDVVPSVCNAVP